MKPLNHDNAKTRQHQPSHTSKCNETTRRQNNKLPNARQLAAVIVKAQARRVCIYIFYPKHRMKHFLIKVVALECVSKIVSQQILIIFCSRIPR